MFSSRTARGLPLCLGVLAIQLGCLGGCAEFPSFQDLSRLEIRKSDSLLIVVERRLYPEVSGQIDAYRRDLEDERCAVSVALWEGGGAPELRTLVGSFMRRVPTGGVLLVGDLPAAWYEQNGFAGREEFPCDLYLMDPDAEWEDRDRDGILDSHSALSLDGFVSRVVGTAAEISRYFEKVHRYRTGDLGVWCGAYIFKDDDWTGFRRGSSFELCRIYGGIDMCEDIAQSSCSSYVAKLAGGGAEYVYQWIHSFPNVLCIRGNSHYEHIDTDDVERFNFKGAFYNLFDCSAARFTEDNLGSAYLMRTDYGLAVLGSTKAGGNYHPRVFHYALARGARWGDAFRCWYNENGVTDDKWFLGMVILGDPMLALAGGARAELKRLASDDAAPSRAEIDALAEAVRRFAYENAGAGLRPPGNRLFE